MNKTEVMQAVRDFEAAALRLNEVLGGETISAYTGSLYLQKWGQKCEVSVHVKDDAMLRRLGKPSYTPTSAGKQHGKVIIDNIEFAAISEAKEKTVADILNEEMCAILDSNPDLVDEDGRLKDEELRQRVLDKISNMIDPDKLDYLVEEIRQSREDAKQPLAAVGMSQADFLVS